MCMLCTCARYGLNFRSFSTRGSLATKLGPVSRGAQKYPHFNESHKQLKQRAKPRWTNNTSMFTHYSWSNFKKKRSLQGRFPPKSQTFSSPTLPAQGANGGKVTSKGFNSKKVGSGTHLKTLNLLRHPEKSGKPMGFHVVPLIRAPISWRETNVALGSSKRRFFPPKSTKNEAMWPSWLLKAISAEAPIETAVLASNHSQNLPQINRVFDSNMSYLACDFFAKKRLPSKRGSKKVHSNCFEMSFLKIW